MGYHILQGVIIISRCVAELWRLPAWGAFIAVGLAGELALAGPVAIETIALQGQTNAMPGTELWNLGAPTIDVDGSIAFDGSTGTPPAYTNEHTAIWVYEQGNLRLHAYSGMTAPGLGGEQFVGVNSSFINGGYVVFRGAPTGPTGWGCWRGSVGNPQLLSIPGMSLPGGGVVGATGVDAMDRSGRCLVDISVVDPPDGRHYGLWVGTQPSDLSRPYSEDDNAPGTFAQFDRLVGMYGQLAENGRWGFFSDLKGAGVTTNNNRGLWAGTLSTVNLACRSGSPAPGIETGGVFSCEQFELRGPINGNGKVAVINWLKGGLPSARYGVWLGPPDDFRLWLRQGAPAPGLVADNRFAAFTALSLSDSDRLALNARLESGYGDTTAQNDQSIWCGGNSNDLRLLVRENDHAAGLSTGIVFESFVGSPILNQNGQVLIEAKLRGSGITTNNDTGLWIHDPRYGLWLVARRGDPLSSGAGDGQEVRELSLAEDGGNGDNGGPRVFNINGQVAFRGVFADGRQGLFRAQLQGAPLPLKVYHSAPADEATGVSEFTNLSWLVNGGTLTCRVYLGTSPALGAGNLRAELAPGRPSFAPGELAGGTTYYWRVDAVNNAGVTAGDVWSFTVRPIASRMYVAPSGGHIPPYSTWASAATNILDLLPYLGSGTEVLVTNGVFRMGSAAHISYGIRLHSVNGPAATILDGGGNVSHCLMIDHSNAVVEGFTLRGASGGSGVILFDGLLQNCVIVSNSGSTGAGAYIYRGRLRNCLVARNTSSSVGGGIYAAGAQIENCTIVSNQAVDFGGGLFLDSQEGTSEVRNCIVALNSAEMDGSDLFANDLETVALDHCCIPTLAAPGVMTQAPQFVAPLSGNYRLLGSSPCIDAGHNLGYPSLDGDGVGRPLIGWATGVVARIDLGAYEYVLPGSTKDSDGDGLSDTNELYGLRTNPADPDSDRDGSSDGCEVYAGTDPLQAASVFALLGATKGAATGSLVLQWSSVTGKTYALNSGTNLFQPFSNHVSHLLAHPPANAYTVTVGGVSTRFYEIQVE